MTIVSQPDITYNIIAAQTQVDNTDQKVLFVGKKTSAGSAVSGVLRTSVQNDNLWDTELGVNSMLSGMIRDARKINPSVRFDYIALDDGVGAISATGTMTFTGAATEDGVLNVVIGSKINHSYLINIAIGDTPTIIGDSVVAAITADLRIPVSAANVTGVITATAVNGGTIGNDIGLAIYGTVAGVTIATTETSSGASDPILTGVFDVIGDARYQTIVWPYYNSLAELKTLLDGRFNTNNDIQDGIGITSAEGTFSDLNTLLLAENSQSIVINVDKHEDASNQHGAALLELGYSKSAQFAAVRSLRLQSGSDISQFVISRSGALDSFGGPALASKPYFNTPFYNFPQIDTAKGFTRVEIETLLDNGGFVFGNNVSGTLSLSGEVVTTYKTDVAGNQDDSFKYLNYVDTISNIREYFYNNLKSRFSQSRLTSGDLIQGYDVANQELIEAYHTQLYTELSGAGFVLTQSGEDALQFFNRNLVVSVDLSSGTVTTQMKTPIVTQFRTMIGTIQIAFSVNG